MFTPNDKLLVKDLNFSLELGGSLLLTGHNGAGKSSICAAEPTPCVPC